MSNRQAMVNTEPGSNRARGLVFGFLAAGIAALYMVFARWGIQRGLSAPDLTALRFGVAGLVMLPLLIKTIRDEPHRLTSAWKAWLLIALCAGAPFGMLMFSALNYAPTSHATVFPFAAMSVMGMMLGALILGERLTLRKVLAIAVVVAGLLLVSGLSTASFDRRALLGDSMFIAAGTLWAAFGIILRKHRLDPVLATSIVAFAALLAYVPAYLALIGVHDLLQVEPHVLWTEVLIQGVIAGAGTVLTYARAVSYLGAARAAVFPALAPGLAALLAAPVLDHKPSSQELVGVVIVMAGLVWAVTGLEPLAQSTSSPSDRELDEAA